MVPKPSAIFLYLAGLGEGRIGIFTMILINPGSFLNGNVIILESSCKGM